MPAENGVRSSKEPRLDLEGEDISNLGCFRFHEILSEHGDRKITFLHAKREDMDKGNSTGEDAVVILEKTPLSDKIVEQLFCQDSLLKLHVKNDIYRNMELTLPPALNTVKATIIYPATEKHIEKYRDHEVFMIRETAEDYSTITLPFINQSQFSIQWVYNVLEHKAEADRIIFEDEDPETGFLIAPDLKWDGITRENLYCTAICRKRGIKSIRDLTKEHLPLLRNILNMGSKAIQEKYGLLPSQLRIFFHYQPSYYHLHVHFTYLKYDAPGVYAGKAHLLEDVIDNIDRYDGYYQKATISYTLKANDKLYLEFRKKKIVE